MQILTQTHKTKLKLSTQTLKHENINTSCTCLQICSASTRTAVAERDEIDPVKDRSSAPEEGGSPPTPVCGEGPRRGSFQHTSFDKLHKRGGDETSGGSGANPFSVTVEVNATATEPWRWANRCCDGAPMWWLSLVTEDLLTF